MVSGALPRLARPPPAGRAVPIGQPRAVWGPGVASAGVSAAAAPLGAAAACQTGLSGRHRRRGIRMGPRAAAGDPGGPLGLAVAQLAEGTGGDAAGLCLFVAAHILAILACFPGTIAFELAAGAVFGLAPGVLLVAAAKGSAAALSFLLVGTLRDTPAGRWVQERVAASAGGEGEKWASRVRAGIQRGSFRFCALARLSPVPSWVNNYVLPVADVPFGTYLSASLLGMLLPLASNVYSGAAAASLAAALAGGPGPDAGLGSLLLPALSAACGVAVVQQLASGALDADPEKP